MFSPVIRAPASDVEVVSDVPFEEWERLMAGERTGEAAEMFEQAKPIPPSPWVAIRRRLAVEAARAVDRIWAGFCYGLGAVLAALALGII